MQMSLKGIAPNTSPLSIGLSHQQHQPGRDFG